MRTLRDGDLFLVVDVVLTIGFALFLVALELGSVVIPMYAGVRPLLLPAFGLGLAIGVVLVRRIGMTARDLWWTSGVIVMASSIAIAFVGYWVPGLQRFLMRNGMLHVTVRQDALFLQLVHVLFLATEAAIVTFCVVWGAAIAHRATSLVLASRDAGKSPAAARRR